MNFLGLFLLVIILNSLNFICKFTQKDKESDKSFSFKKYTNDNLTSDLFLDLNDYKIENRKRSLIKVYDFSYSGTTRNKLLNVYNNKTKLLSLKENSEKSSIRFLEDTNLNDNQHLTNDKNIINKQEKSDIRNITYDHMNFTICGSSICNNAGGVCIGIDDCKCLEGYLDPKDNSIFKCTYKQYDAKIAFFFEFFIGFGSGHFYVKRYYNGMIKFCVYLFLYLSTVFVNVFSHFKKDESQQEVMIVSENPFFRFARILFMCTCFFTCILWQISDSILFYSLFYNDGNDFPLYLYD